MLLSTLLSIAAAASPAPVGAAQSPGCPVMNTEQLPLATRKSPLDSLAFTVGGQSVKVCYGRPSARGRALIGGDAVPFGRLWRTGANEPTTIHTPVALSIAGVRVPAGSYSLYTVPGETEWEVVLNRSTSQWGHESQYTGEVEAAEVGRGKVKPERTRGHVETFTIRAEPAGQDAALVLEWEKTRVRIPVKRGA